MLRGLGVAAVFLVLAGCTMGPSAPSPSPTGDLSAFKSALDLSATAPGVVKMASTDQKDVEFQLTNLGKVRAQGTLRMVLTEDRPVTGVSVTGDYPFVLESGAHMKAMARVSTHDVPQGTTFTVGGNVTDPAQVITNWVKRVNVENPLVPTPTIGF